MSDFETKMHHIRFQLGLRPRPQWGSLQRSPRPPSWILRGPTSKGGKGREREGEERGGERGDGEGNGQMGRGKGRWGREKADGEGKGEMGSGRGREGRRKGKGRDHHLKKPSYGPAVCLSVCLSRTGIESKRLYISSKVFFSIG